MARLLTVATLRHRLSVTLVSQIATVRADFSAAGSARQNVERPRIDHESSQMASRTGDRVRPTRP